MVVEEKRLRCRYCEEFYCYDMTKEWIDFIANQRDENTKKTERNKNISKKRVHRTE
tara:strand:+ start:337 stop:504 length:168 start_codon:yes stop_codon:yes gene_type:complete